MRIRLPSPTFGDGEGFARAAVGDGAGEGAGGIHVIDGQSGSPVAGVLNPGTCCSDILEAVDGFIEAVEFKDTREVGVCSVEHQGTGDSPDDDGAYIWVKGIFHEHEVLVRVLGTRPKTNSRG